jgi:dolichol-phosphate mannosyltransferase
MLPSENTRLPVNDDDVTIARKVRVPEFVKFALVGAGGSIVDFGSYAVLTRVAHLYYLLSTAISVLLAICSNFVLNKYWTFRKGKSGNAASEYTKYLVVSIVNYFLNVGITYFIVEHTDARRLVGSEADYFAKAVAIALVLFSNYFANKYWTFKG